MTGRQQRGVAEFTASDVGLSALVEQELLYRLYGESPRIQTVRLTAYFEVIWL